MLEKNVSIEPNNVTTDNRKNIKAFLGWVDNPNPNQEWSFIQPPYMPYGYCVKLNSRGVLVKYKENPFNPVLKGLEDKYPRANIPGVDSEDPQHETTKNEILIDLHFWLSQGSA